MEQAPPQRPYHHPRIKIVSVEGAIGVGKTTLVVRILSQLRTGPKMRVFNVCEPIEQWERSGMFAEFYKDPKAWAGRFQIYVFSTRIGAFARAYAEALDHVAQSAEHAAVLLLERSCWGDRIFKRVAVKGGTMSAQEDRMYEECFAAWTDSVCQRKPDLVVWVHTPLDESLARIARRGRADEDVPRDYQNALVAEHELALSGGVFESAPVLWIDGRRPYHQCAATADDIAKAVSERVRLTFSGAAPVAACAQ